MTSGLIVNDILSLLRLYKLILELNVKDIIKEKRIIEESFCYIVTKLIIYVFYKLIEIVIWLLI